MLASYKELSPHSRIWIYQCNRELSLEETAAMQKKSDAFVSEWTAHNQDLKAFAAIYYQHFLVLMVDETHAGASGCSIDQSVNFIKELEKEMGISLLDRMMIAYKEDSIVKTADRSSFQALLEQGKIRGETIIFNNLVKNKQEFETEWEIPFGKSWHKKMLNQA